MKPLNEKERTNAFIQFIALLTITLILAMAYVIVINKTKEVDKDVLKKTLTSLEEKQSELKPLVLNLDSLNNKLSIIGEDIDKKFSITAKLNRIKNDLPDQLNSEKNATDEVSKLTLISKSIFNNWITDIERLEKIEILNSEIDKKDKTITNLRSLLEKKQVPKEEIEAQIEK